MSFDKPSLRRASTLAVLAAALLLLTAGGVVSRKVYDPSQDQAGLLTFNRISDRQLVIDATFTGVVRKGARLFSTYDRASAHGKRACPT